MTYIIIDDTLALGLMETLAILVMITLKGNEHSVLSTILMAAVSLQQSVLSLQLIYPFSRNLD
jgi:hypothetical protein